MSAQPRTSPANANYVPFSPCLISTALLSESTLIGIRRRRLNPQLCLCIGISLALIFFLICEWALTQCFPSVIALSHAHTHEHAHGYTNMLRRISRQITLTPFRSSDEIQRSTDKLLECAKGRTAHVF